MSCNCYRVHWSSARFRGDGWLQEKRQSASVTSHSGALIPVHVRKADCFMWPMSGLWFGSLAVQCPASSAMAEMLSNFSPFTSRAGSMAAISLSLSDLMRQNHAAKYCFSSGLSSSSAIIPVNSSIRTTPKLKTSALVVIFPVTNINQHVKSGSQ